MPSSELSRVFCYVYVLYSEKSNNLYVGFTHDLRARLAKHNNGLNFSTKPYRPWSLIYYEAHTKESDAKRRERYLKTTAGDRALRRMLREKLNGVKNLSRQKVYY
ncbi:MAG TPA: GIY-YIG nuclease family protein [Candidatus Saccharimonadales bacterium]|nr:GIY-YIG nuclease family protein [Candidatus Saccharimonadales bacterium]